MFTLDRSLHFINTAGAHVVTVFQSDSPLTVALAGLPPERCEAYVCAIKKNDLIQVYVALLTSSNKILVYADSRPPAKESTLPALLAEALAFAEGMGFRMVEMNLNYGAAMREVVVRNVKVLTPPKVMKSKPVPRKGTAVVGALRRHERDAESSPAPARGAVKEAPAVAPVVEKSSGPAGGAGAADESAELRLELVRLSAEMAAAEKSARDLLAATRDELAEVVAERDLLARRVEEFTQAAEQAAEELAAAHGAAQALKVEKEELEGGLREELAAARGELAGLGKEKGAAAKAHEQAMAAVQAELTLLMEEKTAAAEKGEELSSLLRSAQEELAAVRAELAVLARGGEEAGRRAAEEAAFLRAELEKNLAAKSAAEGVAAEEGERSRKGAIRLAELQAALERAEAEKASAENRVEELKVEGETLTAELESLRARPRTSERLDTSADDLAEAKAELAKLAAGKKAAERREGKLAVEKQELAAELALLRSRLEELETQHPVSAEEGVVQPGHEVSREGSDESLAALKRELEELAAARADADKREMELAVRHQITVAELAAVRAALEKAIAEKISAERGSMGVSGAQRNLLPESRPEEVSASASIGFELPAVRTPQTPWELEGMSPPAAEGFSLASSEEPFALAGSGDSGFSSFYDDGLPPVLFSVNKSMGGVEYAVPEDVIALHLSINVARITPDGELPQGSNAYVCSIMKGKATHVFVAMFLLEDRRSIVYVPEKQPVDEAGYVKTLRDALGFAEAVGFMMDTVALGDDPAQRADILQKIPVLRHATGRKAH